MNDVFDYRIHIEQFSHLLTWLVLLCLFGAMLLFYAMSQVRRFFLTKSGDSFSLIHIQLPVSYKAFTALLGNLSAKTKDTVRLHQRLDLYFMTFMYPCLFFGGWYVLHLRQVYKYDPYAYDLLWMPLLIWLMDYLENQLVRRCLRLSTVSYSRLLLIFSLLKWFFLFSYLVVVLLVLIGVL
jgi:hypothetical protein